MRKQLLVIMVSVLCHRGMASPASPIGLMDHYASIQGALARDQFDEARKSAVTLADQAESWLKTADTRNKHYSHVKKMHDAARELSSVGEARVIREHFAKLAGSTISFVAHQLPLHQAWNRFTCASLDAREKDWLQSADETKPMNPYLGPSGEGCAKLKPWRKQQQ